MKNLNDDMVSSLNVSRVYKRHTLDAIKILPFRIMLPISIDYYKQIYTHKY